jgi:hypothetical protein
LVPQSNENLGVFVTPTPRKHRLWQCLQRVGRPRAKQHQVFDDMGAATSDQELTTNIKPRFRSALYEVWPLVLASKFVGQRTKHCTGQCFQLVCFPGLAASSRPVRGLKHFYKEINSDGSALYEVWPLLQGTKLRCLCGVGGPRFAALGEDPPSKAASWRILYDNLRDFY